MSFNRMFKSPEKSSSADYELLQNFVKNQILFLSQPKFDNNKDVNIKKNILEELEAKIIQAKVNKDIQKMPDLIKECALIANDENHFYKSSASWQAWKNIGTNNFTSQNLKDNYSATLNNTAGRSLLLNNQKFSSYKDYAKYYVNEEKSYPKTLANIIKKHEELNKHIIDTHAKGELSLRMLSDPLSEPLFYNSRSIMGNLRDSVPEAAEERILVSTTMPPSSNYRTIQQTVNDHTVLIGLDIQKCKVKSAVQGDSWTMDEKMVKGTLREEEIRNKQGRNTYRTYAKKHTLVDYEYFKTSSEEVRGMNEVVLKVFDESLLFIGMNVSGFNTNPKDNLENLIKVQEKYRDIIGFNPPIVLYNNTPQTNYSILEEKVSSQPNSLYIIPDHILNKIKPYNSEQIMLQLADKRSSQEWSNLHNRINRMLTEISHYKICGDRPNEVIKFHKISKGMSKEKLGIDNYQEINQTELTKFLNKSLGNSKEEYIDDLKSLYNLEFRLEEYKKLLDGNSLRINIHALKKDFELLEDLTEKLADVKIQKATTSMRLG